MRQNEITYWMGPLWMEGDGKEKGKRMMNEMMNNMAINTDERFEQE